MPKLFLVCILTFLPVSVVAATLNSNQCPDPICCRPSRGLSACYVAVEPCVQTCQRSCPCGIAVQCGFVKRDGAVCLVGEPLYEELPCYTRDISCDEFQSVFNACNDPCCWDPDLESTMCSDVCR